MDAFSPTVSSGWASLAAERGSPMQQFIWAHAFSQTLGAGLRARIVTAGDPASPTALAPFTQAGLLGRMETLGVRFIPEPMDLLASTPEAMRELARNIVAQGSPFTLRRLPADSPAIPALREAFRGRGYIRIAPATPYPFLDLDESWKEPEGKLNAGRRSDFRRAQRHAEKQGAVTFEVCAPAPHELPPLLEEMWQVEAAGWKGERGTALASDPMLGEFYKRVAISAAERGILRLAFMRVGGKAVAAQLDMQCAGRLWLMKIGYDERFAKSSPGQLLMLKVIRYAAEQGLRSIEFLGSREAWTDFWTKEIRECVTLRAYPLTATGLVALGVDAAAYLRKRVAEK